VNRPPPTFISFIAMMHEGAELEACINSLPQVGVQHCVPLPLIDGFQCLCDDEGYRLLSTHPGIETVEVDILISLTGQSIGRSHRRRSAKIVPEGVQAIRAPAAWPISQGAGVGVAIIDTGIDRAHPDLARNIAGGLNLLQPGLPPDDDVGHGTHVAGTVGAVSDLDGVMGVAPKAQLYPVKVVGKTGNGRLSSIILALQWVVSKKIPIVNISLGTPTHVRAFERAVLRTIAAGVTIIASAGNGGPGAAECPGIFPGVLTVGALTPDGQIAHFSGTGPHVDLVAPGVNIFSTLPGGRYGRASGTSMASPHVAGVAALYLGLHPQATPDQVRTALTASAVPQIGVSREQQGLGRVDAWNAIH
jgi:subtilisin family serine protease